MMDTAFWMTLVAAALSGLLAGASLDQSIKQLPARHRIGVEAYSSYSQASDLGNGVVFYGILGISAALSAIAAAIAVNVAGLPASAAISADLGAALAVSHSLATVLAAPTLFSQRRAHGDPAALARVFDRFDHLQTVRVALQLYRNLPAVARLSPQVDQEVAVCPFDEGASARGGGSLPPTRVAWHVLISKCPKALG